MKEKQTKKTGYEPINRRKFLRTAALTGMAGLAGVVFGKKALGKGLKQLEHIAETDEGIKKVTQDYDAQHCKEGDAATEGPCYPNCTPPCKPCYPNCTPCSPIDNCRPKNPCAPDQCMVCPAMKQEYK